MKITLGLKLKPKNAAGNNFYGNHWPLQVIDGPYDDWYAESPAWVVRWNNGAVATLHECHLLGYFEEDSADE